METQAYEFGPYRLEPSTRRLLRGGEPVALTPKAFDTLLALIERRDRVVDKAELMRLVWPDSFVEEANLSQTIFVLRKTLGEGPTAGRSSTPCRAAAIVSRPTCEKRTRSRPVAAQPAPRRRSRAAWIVAPVLGSLRSRWSVVGDSRDAIAGARRPHASNRWSSFRSGISRTIANRTRWPRA